MRMLYTVKLCEVIHEIECVEYAEESLCGIAYKAEVRTADFITAVCTKWDLVFKLKRAVKKMAARVVVQCKESVEGIAH